jgi:hypothetical protein
MVVDGMLGAGARLGGCGQQQRRPEIKEEGATGGATAPAFPVDERLRSRGRRAADVASRSSRCKQRSPAGPGEACELAAAATSSPRDYNRKGLRLF